MPDVAQASTSFVSFADYRNDMTRRRLAIGRVVLILAVVSFVLMDVIVYPQHFTELLVYRLVIVSFLLALYLVDNIDLVKAHPSIGLYTMVLMHNSVLSVAIAYAGGFALNYYIALLLVHMGASVIVPVRLRHHLIILVLAAAVYFATGWGLSDLPVTQARLFEIFYFYLWAGFVVAVGIYLNEYFIRTAYVRDREQFQRIREISDQAMQAEELERKRIAGELHDTIGQEMTGVRLQAKEITLLTDSTSPDSLAANLTAIRDKAKMLDEAANRMQTVLRSNLTQLWPERLYSDGLVAAISHHVDRFNQEHPGTSCRLSLSTGFLDLNRKQASYLFRNITEGLTNISRYAEASAVELEITVDANTLSLRLHDNGNGFDPGRVERHRYGLLQMEERMQALGGQFELESGPGKGTTLRFTLPYPDRTAGI
ncbi:MAG: hypothetical protein AMS22_11100 [Thiotrichales bacterium SG8_50]|nr:MAG: hypothetical protein AMS22_11100 [Thiotrichales bacterium SG8_50]